jgi:hypothetical protein
MSELIDKEDGENRAVRSFLMLYGGSSTTVKKMRDQLECSGFDGCWPEWAAKENGHLTKGGAQDWLRYLFALEPAPTPPAPQPMTDERIEEVAMAAGLPMRSAYNSEWAYKNDVIKFARALLAAQEGK